MSVQAIQSSSVERVPAVQPGHGVPRGRAESHAAEVQQDQVQVSEEGRRLSATASSTASTVSGAAKASESGQRLQLDPRKLRELAGIRAPSDPVRADDRE